MLTFVVRQYEVGEAKRVLRELEDFVEHFVRQIHELRGQIVEQVEKLLLQRNRDRIRAAVHLLDQERRRVPHVLRRPRELQHPGRVPFQLREFFRENGKLDTLCRRIHGSALKVWRKLHAHLRELERRNNRVEDLRARIREMARLPENAVPHRFFSDALGHAVMRSDPNYWDDFERADPPQPRRQAHVLRKPVRQVIKPKARRKGPVVSMEQARLEKLRDWLETTLGQAHVDRGKPLSKGAYTEPEDFCRIIEFAKAALLDRGRRIRRVDHRAENAGNAPVTVRLDQQALSFRELMVFRLSADTQPNEE